VCFSDPLYARFQTIRTLLDAAHDRDGFIDIRDELQAQIDAGQNEYSVDSPEVLRSHGAPTDSPQDTDRLRETANEWELVEYHSL